MLEHHIQKSIVYALAFSGDLRFSQLKPDDIENKLFNYHLKLVIRDGYVEKTENGLYRLTSEGRRIGIRAFDQQLSLANRAESILILVIRKGQSKNSPYLLYKRATHPMLGKVGFMHATPIAGQEITETARQQCLDKTSLNCSFDVLGSGFFTTYEDNTLESFVHFSLLTANEVNGQLSHNDVTDPMATYFWQSEPDFDSSEMIPNMSTLAKLYKANKPFFIEKTFRY